MPKTKEQIEEFLLNNADRIAEFLERAIEDYNELNDIAHSPEISEEEEVANDISSQELQDYYAERDAAVETMSDVRLYGIFDLMQALSEKWKEG